MNLPNTLTVSRIFVVPVMVVVLMTSVSESVFGLPRQLLAVALFLGASLTDLLDGYLARRRGQVTTLGTLLDPIADKLLISAALISLVENKLAPGWAVVIIIGREFAVSGLRGIAAQQGVAIAASKMAKFKMLSQVVAITCLMLGSHEGKPPLPVGTSSATAVRQALVALWHGAFGIESLRIIAYGAGRLMLWIVVFSALWSMWNYFKDFYGAVRHRIETPPRVPLRERWRARSRLRWRRPLFTKARGRKPAPSAPEAP
ncbi:MAG: CDP-diacylglycerol--glycerol-3-phosphate 3-phosphatidyltransferase [Chloracidobacterium sp. CP2_5A]|nr:MAG: CDP-diacylglycerol--glycerol-3-phosphate 3-phosphatidyltransferase [Chloracidobacterium sp. CP2_5A]